MAFDLLHQDGHELEASLYEAGPTRRWLKVKQKAWTVEEDRWQRRIGVRAER